VFTGFSFQLRGQVEWPGCGSVRSSTGVLSVSCRFGRDICAVWRGKPALRVIYRRRRKNVGGPVFQHLTRTHETHNSRWVSREDVNKPKPLLDVVTQNP